MASFNVYYSGVSKNNNPVKPTETITPSNTFTPKDNFPSKTTAPQKNEKSSNNSNKKEKITPKNKDLYKTTDYFEDGEFVIGEDLYPGKYSGAVELGCVIRINGNILNEQNNTVIYLTNKDHLTVGNCGRWKKVF